MRMTLNRALAEARKGNWDKAWAIAQQDEGLLPDVTKVQWIEWAKTIVAKRANNNS